MVSTARKKSKHDLCLLFSSGGDEAEESITPRRIRGYRRSSSSGSPYPARYAGTPVILLFQTIFRMLGRGVKFLKRIHINDYDLVWYGVRIFHESINFLIIKGRFKI
jgi:hypothetical protein